MTAPEIVLLQAQQAQLLLYSMGYRQVYGFIPEQPPDRQQALQLFADLVRKGILQEHGGALQLQSPWKECLHYWGEAQAVLRFHTEDAAGPDSCMYPYEGGMMVCTPQPRRPQMLRLVCLPEAELWNWLVENDRIPGEGEGTLVCEQEGQMDTTLADAWQSGTKPEQLPGFLFLLERLGRDGTPTQRLAAVQRPLYRQLLWQQETRVVPLPYRKNELQRCLRVWAQTGKEESM